MGGGGRSLWLVHFFDDPFRPHPLRSPTVWSVGPCSAWPDTKAAQWAGWHRGTSMAQSGREECTSPSRRRPRPACVLCLAAPTHVLHRLGGRETKRCDHVRPAAAPQSMENIEGCSLITLFDIFLDCVHDVSFIEITYLTPTKTI